MIRPALFGVVFTSLCAWSVGQTSAVIPAANATVEGDSLDPEPFAYNQATHMQYVDRSLLTAVPNGASLSRLAYRRDWGSSAQFATMSRLRSGAPAPVLWEIYMQNYVGPVLNPTNVIQRTGWTNVLTPILVSFPDLPRGAGPTANFDIAFTLDRPMIYTGGPLGIAHVVYEGNNNTFNYVADAVISPLSAGSVARISPTALGCPLDQNRCEGSAPNPGTGDVEFYLFGAKPSTLAVAYFGTNTTSWLGTPLPMGLGFLNLPSCSVYTDLVVPVPMVTSIAGIAGVRASVPGNPALASANIYGQWVAVDDRVNPAVNLATSDGLRFTLGPTAGGYTVPMSVVSAIANLALGRTGFVRRGEGLVFQLGW
jgi:hypothetical protein